MRKTLLIVALLTARDAGTRIRRTSPASSALNTTPTNRTTKGFAVGAGLLIVGFEFEYSSTGEDVEHRRAVAEDRHGQRAAADARLPSSASSRTSQRAPASTAKRSGRARTRVRVGTGGGVKISLAGPLRLRVDYRVLQAGKRRAVLASAPHLRGAESEVLASPRYFPRSDTSDRLTMFCPVAYAPA